MIATALLSSNLGWPRPVDRHPEPVLSGPLCRVGFDAFTSRCEIVHHLFRLYRPAIVIALKMSAPGAPCSAYEVGIANPFGNDFRTHVARHGDGGFEDRDRSGYLPQENGRANVCTPVQTAHT